MAPKAELVIMNIYKIKHKCYFAQRIPWMVTTARKTTGKQINLPLQDAKRDSGYRPSEIHCSKDPR